MTYYRNNLFKRNEVINEMKHYTLQSTIDGWYLGSLFSDSHKDTFCSINIREAYLFSDRNRIENLQIEFGHCEIVEVYDEM